MAALVPTFLIGSSSLHVTRACIKAWISLNFGQIRQLTSELAAPERLRNQYPHLSSVAIDLILFKLADNE